MNFSAELLSAELAQPSALVAVDVDKDGRLDVVVASSGDSRIAWLRLGPDLTVTIVNVTKAVASPNSLAFGDVNNDR